MSLDPADKTNKHPSDVSSRVSNLEDNNGIADNDPRKLSPTPRKSERMTKNIQYDKMNKGLETYGEEYKSEANKGETKVVKVQENIQKISDLLESMKKHKSAHLFEQTLEMSLEHSKYNEVKDSYQPLSVLVLNFNIGTMYKTSDEVIKDLMIMIRNRMMLANNE